MRIDRRFSESFHRPLPLGQLQSRIGGLKQRAFHSPVKLFANGVDGCDAFIVRSLSTAGSTERRRGIENIALL